MLCFLHIILNAWINKSMMGFVSIPGLDCLRQHCLSQRTQMKSYDNFFGNNPVARHRWNLADNWSLSLHAFRNAFETTAGPTAHAQTAWLTPIFLARNCDLSASQPRRTSVAAKLQLGISCVTTARATPKVWVRPGNTGKTEDNRIIKEKRPSVRRFGKSLEKNW